MLIGNFIKQKQLKMKKLPKHIFLLSLLATLALYSCKDERKETEAREEEKVGKVYNPEEQGNEHENRDNQFPQSRNDNKQGTGLETGAPSDTTEVTKQQ